jgi:hypothetical protein
MNRKILTPEYRQFVHSSASGFQARGLILILIEVIAGLSAVLGTRRRGAGVGFLRGLSAGASRGPGPSTAFCRAGAKMLSWSYMPKQPNGTPGKKPSAPSLKAPARRGQG